MAGASPFGYIADESLYLPENEVAIVDGTNTSYSFLTIAAAVAAGYRNIHVSADATETAQITLASTVSLTVNIEPSVTLTLNPGGVWITGNGSRVSITGGGTLSTNSSLFLETTAECELSISNVDLVLTSGGAIAINDGYHLVMNHVTVSQTGGSTLSLVGATKTKWLSITNCQFALVISAIGPASTTEMSLVCNCTFDNNVTIVTGVLNLVFDSCKFEGDVTGAGTVSDLHIQNCSFTTPFAVTGTTTYSSITSSYFDDAASFAAATGLQLANNILNGDLSFSGNVASSSFTGNTAQGLTCSAQLINSRFAGSSWVAVDLGTTITSTQVAGCEMSTLQGDNLTDVAITGNNIFSTVTFTTVDTSTVSGNTATTYSFGATTTSTFAHNTGTSIAFTSTLDTSTVTGNTLTGTIAITGEASALAITGNKCTGISSGASTSADNVVVGNHAVGTGVSGLTGTVASNQV